VFRNPADGRTGERFQIIYALSASVLLGFKRAQSLSAAGLRRRRSSIAVAGRRRTRSTAVPADPEGRVRPMASESTSKVIGDYDVIHLSFRQVRPSEPMLSIGSPAGLETMVG
jgi:hypothetical protein